MKKFLSAALALCLAFSLAACGGSGSSTPASTAPSGGTAGSGAAIKIGGIGPVTGSTAVYGNAVKNGAEIAIAEINALGGQQYEMKFEDDENDAEKAINAYNSLKDWGMQLSLGSVTSKPDGHRHQQSLHRRCGRDGKRQYVPADAVWLR